MKDLCAIFVVILGFSGLVLSLFIPFVGGMMFLTAVALSQVIKNM